THVVQQRIGTAISNEEAETSGRAPSSGGARASREQATAEQIRDCIAQLHPNLRRKSRPQIPSNGSLSPASAITPSNCCIAISGFFCRSVQAL
ncbi:hypothetical protein KI387_024161, partial [Taxus chinensis]